MAETAAAQFAKLRIINREWDSADGTRTPPARGRAQTPEQPELRINHRDRLPGDRRATAATARRVAVVGVHRRGYFRHAGLAAPAMVDHSQLLVAETRAAAWPHREPDRDGGAVLRGHHADRADHAGDREGGNASTVRFQRAELLGGSRPPGPGP